METSGNIVEISGQVFISMKTFSKVFPLLVKLIAEKVSNTHRAFPKESPIPLGVAQRVSKSL
jgi:hypothetical protein